METMSALITITTITGHSQLAETTETMSDLRLTMNSTVRII